MLLNNASKFLGTSPSAHEDVLLSIEELVHISVVSRSEKDIRTILEPLTSLQISLHDEDPCFPANPGACRDVAMSIRNVLDDLRKTLDDTYSRTLLGTIKRI